MAANEDDVWDHIGRLHSRVSELQLAHHESTREHDEHVEPVKHESVGEQLGKGIAQALKQDAEADKALGEELKQTRATLERLIAVIENHHAALAAHAELAATHEAAHEKRHAELVKAIKAPRSRTGEVMLPSGRVAMKITEG